MFDWLYRGQSKRSFRSSDTEAITDIFLDKPWRRRGTTSERCESGKCRQTTSKCGVREPRDFRTRDNGICMVLATVGEAISIERLILYLYTILSSALSLLPNALICFSIDCVPCGRCNPTFTDTRRRRSFCIVIVNLRISLSLKSNGLRNGPWRLT